MKKIANWIWSSLENFGRVNAAGRLARLGYHEQAQNLMRDI